MDFRNLFCKGLFGKCVMIHLVAASTKDNTNNQDNCHQQSEKAYYDSFYPFHSTPASLFGIAL